MDHEGRFSSGEAAVRATKHKLPARAVTAANRILARLPDSTKWSQLDRDIAAAIIANEMGHDKAVQAIRIHLEAVKLAENAEMEGAKAKFEEAKKIMLLALHRH